MKHRKLIRLLALSLSVLLTVGAALSVGAANFVSDVDGDGKITAFDAQLIAESNAGRRTLTDTQSNSAKGISLEDILRFVRGEKTIDAGDTNNDGIMEIYTAEGLQLLRQQLDGSFILMNDLDLQSADWAPIAGFSGSFNGNGKTISNFTINTSVKDTHTASVYNQGFFGDTETGVTISDLHLKDVTLNAAADTTSMGFFAGSLRGHVTGCTVIGTINDNRETYPTNMYTGIFAGKLNDNSNGSVVGGTALSISDEVGVATTANLCANVKLNITNDDLNKKTNGFNKVGLVGYIAKNCTVSGKWTDTSYSSELRSEIIQTRQDKVVNYMNAMGSVKWTPSEDLVYTANNGTNQTFTKGNPYIGLPYNAHNGSYERFLSAMASQDANGVYTTQEGLTSGGYIASGITKKYIRMGTKTDNTTGQVSGIVYKDTVVPTEVITFSADGNTLCYVTANATYYLGGTSTNENFFMTGTSVSPLPAHLYAIGTDGKATLVTVPKTGTAYKLGLKNADGSIVYFNGESITIADTGCLQTTAEPGEAVDMYLEEVSGGYRIYFETDGAWTEDGFHLIMGNDCSGAVNWAWLQVSNTQVTDGSGHQNPYMGGVNAVTTNYMIPNDANRPKYGIYPVGNWEPSVVVGTLANGSEKRVSAEYDPSTAAYSCTDQIYTPAVLQTNGMDTILEAYAQTHKADALVCYVDFWTNGNPRPGGHVRLVSADPVVIRNTDGSIDSKASYFLISEQGATFSSNSTWSVNKKLTFYALAGSTAEEDVTLRTRVYIPITIRALMEDYEKPTYVTIVSSAPVNSPAEGRIYTYHHINSVTVTVMNNVIDPATGNRTVLYQHEAFTGISNNGSSYRGKNHDIYLSDLHADAFYAFAKGNLRNGKSYFFNVDILLSTGEVVRLFDEDKAFTYRAS